MPLIPPALLAEGRAAGERLAQFIHRSPSPYHCVATAASLLEAKGFVRVDEASVATVEARRFYFTRNLSCLVACDRGADFDPSSPRSALKIIGAHTDSPCLRLKPNSAVTTSSYLQFTCSTYGGGLWGTWFDRDLSAAGKVVVRDAGRLVSRLVDFKDPICLIPSLAIHLDRPTATPLDKEKHLTPIFRTVASASEDAGATSADEAPGAHHRAFIDMVAAATQTAAADIVEFDLCLYDSNPPAVWGAGGEFLSSARLDNQLSCFAAVEGLLRIADETTKSSDTSIVVLFDHEECGSESAHGAASDAVATLVRSLGGDHSAALARRSLCVSADGAHLMHPNYPQKHHPAHAPVAHRGPIVKFNPNQRYATSATTAAIIAEIAKTASVPLQRFIVSNESPCGTTIGPILASKTGIRTLDIGVGQWAMHSIRESCGTLDVHYFVQLMEAFFRTAVSDVDSFEDAA